MNVAKTYQNWEQYGEIITLNNKQYVDMKKPNSDVIKRVRVYSDNEYKRLYGTVKSNSITPNKTKNLKTEYTQQKKVLGFQKGYIHIVRGNIKKYDSWLRKSTARYHRGWGWYFVSESPLPTDLPKELKLIKLPWKSVGKENGALKDENLLSNIINNL